LNKSYSKELISGAKWGSISQVFNQASVFIGSIYLMRHLTPEDFGVVSIITFFTGLLMIFSSVGLSASFVNKTTINNDDKDTLFWTSFTLGFTFGIVAFFSSHYWGLFFENEEIEPAMQLITIVFFLSPIIAVPAAILKRKLAFKELAMVSIVSTLISFATAIVLAIQGFGLYSLIWQRIVYTALNSILLFHTASYTPTFIFKKEIALQHLKFGIPLLGSKLINYAIGNADNLLIGKFLGTATLGFYSRAYAIVTIPTSRISIIFGNVLFPVLSKMKNEKNRLKEIVLQLNSLTFFILFFLPLIFIATSDSFVRIISIKSEWDPIIPLIQILAFVAFFKSIVALYSNIIISKGDVRLSFNIELLGGIIIVLGFILGVQFKIEYFTIIYLVSMLLFTSLYIRFLLKRIHISFKEYFHSIKIKAFIFIALLPISFFFIKLNLLNEYLKFSLATITIGILWIALNYVFDKDNTLFLFKTLKRVIV